MARFKPTTEDVAIHRITERNRTIRWGLVCCVVGLGIWKIADEIGDYFDKPGWEVVVNSLTAVICALLIPGPVYWIITKRIRRFTSRMAPRAADLEQSLDPGRSSSELLRDGTDPQIGPPP